MAYPSYLRPTAAPTPDAYRDDAPDWRLRAECAGTDPELFFPTSEHPRFDRQVDEATAVCSGCPVVKECLDAAMAEEAGRGVHRHGIRGGLTASQRHNLHRRRTRKDRS